jgi:biopolymer transport protein ExbD
MNLKKPTRSLKLEVDSHGQTLISPLNIRIAYQSPKSEMDLIPFLDAVLIGFLFFMLSSRLVFAPGIAVDIPRADLESLDPVLVTDVMTVSRRGANTLFFYEGALLDFEGLRGMAESEDSANVGKKGVLLIKMDADLSIQLQAELVSVAKLMGYSRVQMAIDAVEGYSDRGALY